MALTVAKQHILKKNGHAILERAKIEHHDIVGLVHYAWENHLYGS